jgi:hypothetical protein
LQSYLCNCRVRARILAGTESRAVAAQPAYDSLAFEGSEAL